METNRVQISASGAQSLKTEEVFAVRRKEEGEMIILISARAWWKHRFLDLCGTFPVCSRSVRIPKQSLLSEAVPLEPNQEQAARRDREPLPSSRPTAGSSAVTGTC